MLHPTSLILLPFVVLVSLVMNSSEANRDEGPNIHPITTELKKAYDDLNLSFHNFKIKLIANNDLKDAMKAYREAYTSTKGTHCAGEEPLTEVAVERIIAKFVSGCMKSVPKNEMLAFFNKISLLKDKALKIVKGYYDEYISHPTSWKESFKQAIEKLNGIRTLELPNLKREGSAVLEILKNRVAECFQREIAENLKHLLEGTEAINTCIGSKS